MPSRPVAAERIGHRHAPTRSIVRSSCLPSHASTARGACHDPVPDTRSVLPSDRPGRPRRPSGPRPRHAARPARGGGPPAPPDPITFEFDLCGVPTRLTLAGLERNHEQGGVQNQLVTFAYTNLLTGVTLTSVRHATLQELAVTENEAGGLSFTFVVNGLLVQLRDGKRVLLVDAGRIVLTDAFDADGNFLGEVVVETPGPAHQDEAAFCAAYLAATA